MNSIVVSHLTRNYGDGKGIFDISFEVGEGEIFGFLGPNGAGKTTTIRHLMGFLRPQHGSCSVCGRNCLNEREQVQARLGYIPGEISFFNDMTGTGFLDFMKKYRKIKSPDRTKELLDRFELNPQGAIKKMSKGMKQKIGIVAAFMHDPEILILDEPTGGLDPLMQNRFIGLLEEERKRGKTVLLSSHMFDEVERSCHRIGIIRSGHLVAMDSITALKSARIKKFAITFSSETEAERFTVDSNIGAVRNGTRVDISTHNLKELIALLSRYEIEDLTEISQSLEEIFMQYYGDSNHAE